MTVKRPFLIASLAAALLAGCGGRRPAAPDRAAEHEAGAVNQFPSDRGPMPALPASIARVLGPTLALSVAPGAEGAEPEGTLVLYDDTGPYACLGELYAIADRQPGQPLRPAGPPSRCADYAAGELPRTPRGHLHRFHLRRAAAGRVPGRRGQRRAPGGLAVRQHLAAGRPGPGLRRQLRLQPWRFDFTADRRACSYKGRTLTRDADNGSGIMEHATFDPTRATVLAAAVRGDGSQLPWAVRSGNLTYVGEIPFAYVTARRSLPGLRRPAVRRPGARPPPNGTGRWCASRTSAPTPTRPNRCRPSPTTCAGQKHPVQQSPSPPLPRSRTASTTTACATGLHASATTPEVRRGAASTCTTRGGTLSCTATPTSDGAEPNPYDGVSANDFEFYRAHVDVPTDSVIYDGPVDGDSATWALGRIEAGLQELASDRPAGADDLRVPALRRQRLDYRAVATRFPRALRPGPVLRRHRSPAPATTTAA